MHRKISFFILLICLITNLSGCYDAHEVNGFTWVTMFGLDKGISDKWRLTVQFRSISQSAGSGQSSGGGGSSQGGFIYQTETIDAPSFFAAVNLLNTNIPRELNFEHSKLIVISEDIARSGLLGEFIAPLVRFRQIRRTANLAVSEGNAEDFIENFMPFIGSTVTATIENLFSESRINGYFPMYDLNDFYEGLKTTYGQPIIALGAVNNSRSFKAEGEKWGSKFNVSGDYYAGETPRKSGNKIELLGSAVFDGDTMVGKLTGNECRMMLIARGKIKKLILTVQDPKANQFIIPLQTTQRSKPKIDVKFVGGKPVIDLTIDLAGEILAIQSRIDYESIKLMPVLEQATEKFIKDGIQQTINKCKELDCDVFNFGNVAARKFGTIEEWEKYNWNSHFKDAKINVDVKYTIKRSGSMLKNSAIKSAEGKE